MPSPIELFNIFGRVSIDGREAKSNLKQVVAEGEKTEKKLSKNFSNIGKAVKRMSKPLLAAGVIISGIGAVALKMASDVEEMQSKFKIVFGEMTDSTRKWADEF